MPESGDTPQTAQEVFEHLQRVQTDTQDEPANLLGKTPQIPEEVFEYLQREQADAQGAPPILPRETLRTAKEVLYYLIQIAEDQNETSNLPGKTPQTAEGDLHDQETRANKLTTAVVKGNIPAALCHENDKRQKFLRNLRNQADQGSLTPGQLLRQQERESPES